MTQASLIVVTGLPGTGKTQLARQLASRYRSGLLAKDTIKEPLARVVHALHLAAPRVRSRDLSDAAFALLIAIAGEQLGNASSLILEGNFRAAEHEPALLGVFPRTGLKMAQILCRTDEPERLARLARRQMDGRDCVHRLEDQRQRAAACDRFLELPGERLEYENGAAAPCAIDALLAQLDRFHSSARIVFPP